MHMEYVHYHKTFENRTEVSKAEVVLDRDDSW